MSKSSETRLTRSRKPRRPFRLDVDLLDGLIDHCHNITTLAGLLESVRDHADAEPLEATLVHNAGSLILCEARQLQALLAELGKAAR